MYAAILFSITVDFFTSEIGVQTCCSSELTAAPWEGLSKRACFLQEIKHQFVCFVFFSPCVKIELARTKFQNHSSILHTSNLRQQRLQANKVVGVFACGSVGAHVAEGRSLAEYRLEEVDVLKIGRAHV